MRADPLSKTTIAGVFRRLGESRREPGKTRERTVYTLTDKRVVMRIGIVLTLTFNIPYRRIAAAGLHLDTRGTGDLPLALLPPDHIAYLHLWPHARSWRVARPEPMLRSVLGPSAKSAATASVIAASGM